MANHSVAVAKASLIAPFVRPDPTSIARDEVTAFHIHLDAAIDRCSPGNIQKCRAWLSANATSPNRVSAVAKYLGILSASFLVEDEVEHISASKQTSTKRRRLHLLYVINDWLHSAHHHQRNTSLEGSILSEALQPHLPNLVALVAACDLNKNKRVGKRLVELLQLWQTQRYYDVAFVDALREATSSTEQASKQTVEPGIGQRRNADAVTPFNLPPQHGDSSIPWYDLPAANMLPHISPNSSFPIDAELVKPIRFNPGPADSALVALVQDLIRDAETLYGGGEPLQDDRETDYDELGQKILKSKSGGDILYGETYYGWSKEFCERMKRKQNESLSGTKGRRQSLSASRNRYSSSVSQSRSRSRSRDGRPAFRQRSRSSSSGRSRSPRRSSRRPLFRSRSRTRSKTRSRARSREKSYSPPAPMSAEPPPTQRGQSTSVKTRQDSMLQAMFNNVIPNFVQPPPHPFTPPQPSANFTAAPQSQFPPPFPPHIGQYPPAGMPTPPPRPPNWQGPWPPPPPPPPVPSGGPPGYGQYPGQQQSPPPHVSGQPFYNQQIVFQQQPPSGQPGWGQFSNAGQGPPPPPPPPSGNWSGSGGRRW